LSDYELRRSCDARFWAVKKEKGRKVVHSVDVWGGFFLLYIWRCFIRNDVMTADGRFGLYD